MSGSPYHAKLLCATGESFEKKQGKKKKKLNVTKLPSFSSGESLVTFHLLRWRQKHKTISLFKKEKLGANVTDIPFPSKHFFVQEFIHVRNGVLGEGRDEKKTETRASLPTKLSNRLATGFLRTKHMTKCVEIMITP